MFQIVDDRGHPTLPVLSATQNQGMIYRDDSGRYIGHDESNEIGYKRVLPGDFVVHLRSFQGGFAHSQYEGITSPAYTVFRAKEPTSHSDRFWKHWFISEHFIAGLSTVTYGIRDGRSISVDELQEITYRAMMGEFIIYYRGKIVGGIYDDRLLVKPTKSAISYMPTVTYEIPYENAKEMLLVEEVDNKDFLTGLFDVMYDELPTPKPKKKK